MKFKMKHPSEMISDCLINAIQNSDRTRTMDQESRAEVERIVREGLGIINDEWIVAQVNRIEVERVIKERNGRT